MQLYENKDMFSDLILRTSNHFNILPEVVEKDYFVTIILQELQKEIPNMLFKGGTSLSKCYDLIKRFSEDIDITIVDDFTQGKRQSVKKSIVKVCGSLGLEITNLQDTKSRRDFNKYEVDYGMDEKIPSSGIKSFVQIETVFIVKTFSYETRQVDSLIYKFLKDVGMENVVDDIGIQPFDITTQSVERTFIDKIFALCDYYIDGNIKAHSRHLYDLYKICDYIVLNDELKQLALEVRMARCSSKQCYSAQQGVDVNKLLTEIVQKEVYKSDYDNITSGLLFEEVPYSQAIEVIHKIIKNGLMD